ncbi:nicotinate-nucleotide adenylyltransferase [Aquibacillus rhizosphaerae]|uniref:Probable nicotinate-nucleotide adenylyltransferase n=1 Tax=Aquibacillus rhizosphaerae TaxID=3051431 RepID=A0ABT7L6J2_9BACI|nr:nicotinate-nucleotide adenylyltransferase [Aquibacillus sp. LR5S19]MDL4841472.1 nicotinate-nucleotide adenylyltransferase [Aquibacillus sp. LR5S19]
MKKIGILGGTFDPPHLGHLLIAEEVNHKLNLDQVWFIPSYEPPHKEKSNTKIEQRIAMIETAIKDNHNFSLSTIEVDRLGKSYTFDTIKLLKEKFPETMFYFIIGADMVEYLPKWYKIDQLTQLVQFVGVKRPEYKLNTNYPVIEVDIPVMEISSTMIRERIANNQSVRYLVPSNVLELIKEYHLYDGS